jgi:hypothetical protein
MLPTGFNAGCLMVLVGFGSSELEKNLCQYYSKAMNFGLIRKSQFVFHGVFRTFEKTEGRVWSNLAIAERAIRSPLLVSLGWSTRAPLLEIFQCPWYFYTFSIKSHV